MDEERASDAVLVRRARRGDREAFGLLVRRYLRPGLAVAWEWADTREDAEDLVQEAFYRSLRRLDRFDEGRPFGPWFYTIVRNLARNEAGRRARWRTESIPADAHAAERGDAAERGQLRDRLEAALGELTPMQRACFRLCEVEGFERAEVADMLDISGATVRVHLHRAKLALRERLRSLGDEAARR